MRHEPAVPDRGLRNDSAEPDRIVVSHIMKCIFTDYLMYKIYYVAFCPATVFFKE